MIEYDIAETAEHDNPEPGVFLKLRTNANSERDRMSTELLPHALEELARAVGWSDWRAERDAVGKALAALASSGEILHVGARPNLQPRAVRLVARRIDADALPTVLNRLHWPGAVSEVTRSLGQLEGVFNEFMLSIDVTAAGLLPRLGMELSQTLPAKELEHTTARHLSELSRRAMSKGSKHKVDNAGLGPWLTTGRGDWQPLISRLRDLGWCLPEKAQGLLAWPKLATINRNGKAFLLYRGINHIKLLIGADHTINAKAYAGMSFAELTP